MNTLNLIIKQKYFDKILSGEKKKEYREIRPNTANKYCEFDKDDQLVGPKEYDVIRFYVGYQTDRPSALVKIESAIIEISEDEEGQLIVFEENGKEYVEAQVIYDLGEIIETQNV